MMTVCNQTVMAFARKIDIQYFGVRIMPEKRGQPFCVQMSHRAPR